MCMYGHIGCAWIASKPKFWSLFDWVPKFTHLSHLPYQNVGKFFAQHLTSQNLGSNPSRPIIRYERTMPHFE